MMTRSQVKESIIRNSGAPHTNHVDLLPHLFEGELQSALWELRNENLITSSVIGSVSLTDKGIIHRNWARS
jgi:hypothetical protein